jgi:biopolymer transport protein ExbD
MRKFHQSTQQDKQFLHSIRFEIIFYIFSLLIKEAMASYMMKEFNLLENKLLSQSSKEMEELAVLQAKELAMFIHEQQQQQQQGDDDQEEGQGQGEGEENGAVAKEGGGGGEEQEGGDGKSPSAVTGAPAAARTALESKTSSTRIYSTQSSSMTQDLPPATSHHPFHTPIDLKSIDDVSVLKKKHEENKVKLENYLSERRRQKRKYFDDAKRVTFEKLTSKLNDIKVDSENAMLSPAGLGKYKTIMKIIHLMRSNGK